MPLFRSAPPPIERRRSPRSADIDDHVRRRFSADAPGLALAVCSAGTILHAAGYGLADVRGNVPVEPDTIFHTASCGKQFTGLGILMLAEEGKLSLDDPVGRHLNELSGFGPQVTLRRLLHHTSGIRDFYDDDGVDEVLSRCERPGNDDVIRTYADLGCPMAGFLARAGGTFRYSNSGYELLGSVIERVSGESYHDFFQRRVFDRLGMNDTFSVPDHRARDRRRAVGYGLDHGEFFEQEGTEFDDLIGAGSFYSTVTDLCLYDHALATNALVSAESMRIAFTSGKTNNGRDTGYGFGWYVSEDGGEPVADHEGSWIGYYAYFRRYLARPLSVFALSNNPELVLSEIVDAAVDAVG